MFGSRQQVYTVHINPKLPNAYENPVFVREGFNIYALIFSGFWTLYHRLWWPTFAIVVVELFFLHLFDSGTVNEIGRSVMEMGFALFVGFEANDWQRAGLARRGYVIADIVTGDSLIRAEQRFFDRYFAQKQPTTA
jgi:hypothetical protein